MVSRSRMSRPIRAAETVSSSPQIHPLTRASVNECAIRRSSAASISGDFRGPSRTVEVARPHHRADTDERFWLEQAERAGDVPPGMIRMAHDVALGREPDMLALVRMAERNVRDLLRQSDREADV